MRELFIILVSVGLIVTFEAAAYALRFSTEQRARELKRRLQAVIESSGAGATLLRRGQFARNPALDAWLRTLPIARRIEKILSQADSRLTVAQLCGYSLLGLVVSAAVTVLANLGLIVGALLCAATVVFPFLALTMARDRRARKLSEQLPEALDMMARSLRAGHATPAAFQLVSTEMPEPASVEFGRAFEEQRLGVPLERAIFQMTERMPSNTDLKIFAVSTVIQKETGGNLAEILSNIAETVRARYRFFGKLRALTGEGRASAAVLGALPLVTAAVVNFTTPGYLAPLVTSQLGKVVLAYAMTSWAVGLVAMYRMTKVDY